MKAEFVRVAVVLAFAAGLAACSSEPRHDDPAMSGSSAPRSSKVTSPTDCPPDTADQRAAVRHGGDATPGSGDPNRNPCWPN
jgi:hypothetical protein